MFQKWPTKIPPFIRNKKFIILHSDYLTESKERRSIIIAFSLIEQMKLSEITFV